MSKQEQAFDNIIKRSLAQQSFEFNEAYWEAAQELLDELPPADTGATKGRSTGALLLSLLLLFSLAGFSLWLWSNSHDLQKSNRTTELSLESDDQHLSEPGISDFPLNPSEENLSIPSSEPITTDPASSNPKDVEYSENLIVAQEEGGLLPADKNRVTQDATIQKPTTAISAKGKLQKGTIKNNEVVSERLFQDKKSISAGISSENILGGASVEDNMMKEPLINEVNFAFDEVPILISPSSLPLKTMPSIDQFNRHQVGVVMGGNLSLGLKNGAAERDGLSTNPLVGLRYSYALNRRLNLQTGVQFQGRGGLNAEKAYEVIKFSFGFQKTTTTLTSERAYYMIVPLSLSYQLKNRHYLSLGGYYSKLLGSRGETTITNEDSFNLRLARPSESSPVNWNNPPGLNSKDWGLLLGYSYYLGQGLHLGMDAQYGLQDLTQSDYFDNEEVDHDLQLRIHLTYDLIRRK